MPSAKRLFIGIDLPKTIKTFLSDLQEPRIRFARWTSQKNFHLTLRFLGDIETDVEENLIQELAKTEVRSFTLPIEGLGKFPPRGRPAIVWAGCGKGHPNLFQLRQQVDDLLIQLGIDCEMNDFIPHITLGRCKDSPLRQIEHYLKEFKSLEGPVFKVETFTLFESRLSPQGPKYFPVDEFRLQEN